MEKRYNSITFSKVLLKDNLSGKIPELEFSLLSFDPALVYDRIWDKINPYSRAQKFSFSDAFPMNENGYCDCGCGKLLDGKKIRWHSYLCSRKAFNVCEIIKGRLSIVFDCLVSAHGYKCNICGATPFGRFHTDWGSLKFEVDHILAIKNGGGGCWLNNFQLLCTDCHKDKTLRDLGWKKRPKPLSSNDLDDYDNILGPLDI